jgi:hypothetical protein
MAAPDFLYHHTTISNRDGILRDGLLQSMSDAARLATEMGMEGGSGIYFCEMRPEDDPRCDVWKVDVRGLVLAPDETTDPSDPDDVWWVHHAADVPAWRMELLEPEAVPAFGR